MEHVFVLSSITHKKEEEKSLWKYKYKLVKPSIERKMEIHMGTSDPMSAEANTELPLEIGDIVYINTGKTNAQATLKMQRKEEDD